MSYEISILVIGIRHSSWLGGAPRIVPSHPFRRFFPQTPELCPHSCTDKHSAKYLRGCSAGVWSSGVHSPLRTLSCRHLCARGACLGCHLGYFLDALQAVAGGLYLVWFPPLRDHCPSLPDVQCLEILLHIFCPVFQLFLVRKINKSGSSQYLLHWRWTFI